MPIARDHTHAGISVLASGSTTSRTSEERFSEPINVKDYGAVGASASDASAFQAALDTGNKHIFVPVGAGTYTVNLKDLNYGSGIPVRWEFEEGARTTDVQAPQAYVFPGGGSGADQPMEWIPDAADQMNVYSVRGTNNAESTGKLFAYDFNLTAGENTTDDEPIRGLIGRCTNLGTGSVKSVRVGATDSSESGAAALMAIDCDVIAQANTSSARVLSVNNLSADGIDDVVIGAYFNSNNGARWKNGIVFDQGDEYEDAVFQASMGSGSGTAARFLKLKDDSAAVVFSVAKSGEVFSADSLHAGVSTSNSVKISTSSIERTAAAGDLTIKTGSNSGRVLVMDAGGSSSQFKMTDAGIRLGNATGGHKGVGTINAKGYFDDDVAVTDYVLEFAVNGSFDTSDYPGSQAERFYNSAQDELDLDAHSEIWKTNLSLPGMPSRNDWSEGKWSLGKLVQGLWEELEKAHVFIDQLNRRISELEKSADGNS